MSEADERHRQSTVSRIADRRRDANLDAAMAHHPAGKQRVTDGSGTGNHEAIERYVQETQKPGVLIPAEHLPTLTALLEHAESWRNEWNEYIRPSKVEHEESTEDELAEQDKEFDEVAGLITYIRGQQD